MPKKIGAEAPFPVGKRRFASELTINGQKRSALHIAARFGKTECARVLVAAGARIEARDKDGKTPLQLAAWKKHCGVVKVLVSARAKEDRLNNEQKRNFNECAPGK